MSNKKGDSEVTEGVNLIGNLTARVKELEDFLFEHHAKYRYRNLQRLAEKVDAEATEKAAEKGAEEANE